MKFRNRARSLGAWILWPALLFLTLPGPVGRADDAWLPASPEKLPRWRGFNLLNYFQVAHATPFSEDDFRMIHEFGFNFVRLPMDYRIWIVNGDWNKINEDALRNIDQAIAYGEKYHIHVCLNFHRAPGYTVAHPHETRDLWTDPEAQRVCAMHWATFARRYKGIPGDRLSFDLFNEPPDLDPKVYAHVIGLMAAAIRQEDPKRLIIADGLAWGNKPCPELIPLHVAQATRGYLPIQLTHYHAKWMNGSDKFPLPTWPIVAAQSHLYGPAKKPLNVPLVLHGTFPAGTELDLVVNTVSTRSRLVVSADGRTIFSKEFVSGPKSIEGEKVVYLPQFKNYQNVFNQPEQIRLTAPASRLTVSDEDGDWMTLDSLALRTAPGGAAHPLPLFTAWGQRQPSVVAFDPARPDQPWSGPDEINGAWLWQHDIVPWKALEAAGSGVIVGEWGCYDKTPYEVTLRWMQDNLANFKRAGWGWALWNFEGSFGVLDSDRPGAVYENYQGHKLDRRMLELLQRN
jgi:aryl-phospho-beta-D-glucosidase BglC (GH1 family)